jgi:hypothetical protein
MPASCWPEMPVSSFFTAFRAMWSEQWISTLARLLSHTPPSSLSGAWTRLISKFNYEFQLVSLNINYTVYWWQYLY